MTSSIYGLCVAAALSCLLPLAVGTVHGAESFLDLTSEVAGHAGMTFADLLELVMPDLVIDGTSVSGHLAIAIPNIDRSQFNRTVPEHVTISSLQAQRFEADGKEFIAILAPISEDWLTMLAVFEDGETPVFIDAVDVGLDNHNEFATPALLQIAADSQALVTSSWHSNSGEYYDLNAVVFLRGGQLELVDSFSTYSATSCGLLSRQNYVFNSAPGSPYYTISAALSDVGGPPEDEEPCGTTMVEPYDHSQTKTYHWDAATKRFTTSARSPTPN